MHCHECKESLQQCDFCGDNLCRVKKRNGKDFCTLEAYIRHDHVVCECCARNFKEMKLKKLQDQKEEVSPR
jgi:Fe2+ or Zn2+ uptake regulation protein